MKKALLLMLVAFPLLTLAQPKLVPHPIALEDGRKFNLNLPAEFEIIAAAEGLKRVRFFARAPDGRIFVTDMYNLTDNTRGAVYILDDWNVETGKFSKVIPYMTGLKNPNSVQFYRDAQGQDWFYLAETDKLTRRKFTRGEEKPTDTNPQTIATFPDYGLSYKYGGWHLTRTIAFGSNGKLYVSVGSSCNSCVEKEPVRASIVEMNADGSGQRQFARGLRNAVGLKWFGNFLFATNQGSDHLGLNRPDETFYAMRGSESTTPASQSLSHPSLDKEGSGRNSPPVLGGVDAASADGVVKSFTTPDYGWPYCHSNNGRIFADPKFKRRSGCAGVVRPYAWFPARSSALGFDYFNDADAPPVLKDAFVVALHGSTNKDVGRGYKIVRMRKGKRLQDLITGFLQGKTVHGRPCDIMKLDANSFLFTDDHRGVIYLVRRRH